MWMWMSVIKASLKGHRFWRSLRRILPTSELSPSFPATLESHPSSLSALMQHGILKQAVYIERSAGGGHRTDSMAQDEEGIQTTTTLKHKHTHAHTQTLLSVFLLCFTSACLHTVGRRIHAHVSTNTHTQFHCLSQKAHNIPKRVFKYQRSTDSPPKG